MSQEALNLLVTEERYWALFYMPLYTRFYTICWMYWYRLQIKWDYKKTLCTWNLVSRQLGPDWNSPTVSLACVIHRVIDSHYDEPSIQSHSLTVNTCQHFAILSTDSNISVQLVFVNVGNTCTHTLQILIIIFNLIKRIQITLMYISFIYHDSIGLGRFLTFLIFYRKSIRLPRLGISPWR
jgi:hypothetical protein